MQERIERPGERTRIPGQAFLPFRLRKALLFGLLAGGAASLVRQLPAQQNAPAQPPDRPFAAHPEGGNLLSVPPRAWAEDAAHNELKVIQFDRFYLRYRARIDNARGLQLRDVIESRDGSVARLIEKDGRALTTDEDKAERERLQAMLDSPSAFAKHVRGDITGKKLAVDLVKLMPDAMIFTYTPGQPQTERSREHPPEVVMDFHPNPDWRPPTMAAESLTGFEGRIWIDSESHMLVKIEGTIFQGINFGFGFVAHIFPGGKVTLEQANAGQQHWIFSHFVEHVTVRALMVKTMHENSDIATYGFQIVPPMSYQDAIHLLLNEPAGGK
jgi:hypothetical protein